ncbi:MAG: M20/M25/M40 family metallo-hydrolase, partial [Bryobacteraceae bacterium]
MEIRYYNVVDALLAHVRTRQARIVDLIAQLVGCESPSGDSDSIDRFVSLVEDVVAHMAEIRTLPGGHLRCEFQLPGSARKSGQILALGHSDTVWPVGTLQKMPFRNNRGRLWGPGVLDMKSGIAFFINAMQTLRELRIPVRRRVVLLLNADEEVGSESSRAFTIREAKRSEAVLVLEPGTGLEGKLKTARKGVG